MSQRNDEDENEEQQQQNYDKNDGTNKEDEEGEEEGFKKKATNPIKQKAYEVASTVHNAILEAIREEIASYAS
eukprot:407633-Ditylum_brightwellii.AAC.1